MSNNSTFDDDEKIQILIKKSFQVPATYEQTKWFNEAKGVSRTILEASDINSKTVPTTPIWDDASLNETDLESYGIKLDPTQNFATSPYDEIHTFADATYSSYSKTISIDPGAYIDSTGTVMLFVKLKLDRMDTPSASAIAYTKYHIDSSQNSILDNAYQFNYNQQRNVLDSDGNFISLFKPYAYYLQLSTDGGSNFDLLSPEHGNWFFDFKSGIITFSDDPNDSSFGDNAKDVTNGDLYFTFVKYVGPRGLDKLISVDDAFDSTADTSAYYENQIVVDSANSEIYLMKNGSWNSIGGGGSGGSEDSIYQPMYAIRNNVSSMSDFENLFGVTFETYNGTSLEVTDGNTTASISSTTPFKSDDTNYADNTTLIIKYKIDNYPNDASSAILYEAGGNGSGFVIGFKQKNNLVVYGGEGTAFGGTEAVSNLFGENASFDISQYENETNMIGLDISFVQGTSSTIADFKLYFNNVLIGETYSHDLTNTYIWGTDGAGLGMYASAINQVFESDLTNITPLELEVGSFVGVLLGSVYEDYSFYNYKMLDINKLNVDNNLTVGGAATITGDATIYGGDLYIGTNDGNQPGKIYFGGAAGDTTYSYSTIEARIYDINNDGSVDSDRSEMLLFQGNDLGNSSGPDRIRLYSGEIWFDTIGTTSTTAVASSTSGSPVTAMMISNDSNVGIGTTSPSCELDISGATNISSDLTVGNNIYVAAGSSTFGASLGIGNGNTGSGTSKAQIAFGFNSTSNYQHFIASRHDSLKTINNAIDFYLCDKTTNNSITSGCDRVMTIANGGVGIGQAYPSCALDVNGTANIGSDLTVGGIFYPDNISKNDATLVIGVRSGSGTATASNSYSWAEFQTAKLALSGPFIELRPGSTTSSTSTVKLKVESSQTTISNDVGIGTSPSYPLHITNTVTDSSVPMYMIGNGHVDDIYGNTYSGHDGYGTRTDVGFWYGTNRIGDLDEGRSGGLIWEWTESDIPISVYSTGAFVSEQTFATTSDRRIKTNIVDISDDEALVQFRKLQPKKYNYIDFKKKTTQQVYGFIAQEVAQEIPNSTTQTSSFIPDLYCYGEVDVCNNTIKILQKSIIIDSSNQTLRIQDVSLNVDLSVNDTLKCYDASNTEFEIGVSNIETLEDEYILTIDASNIELSKHSYYNIGDASGNILHNNLVFIYGKKVDDLHHLKKDSIWTVAAAALQEVDRQQQADKVRIAELETEVSTLKNQVSTFETQISELLARVSSLENNSSTTTDGS